MENAPPKAFENARPKNIASRALHPFAPQETEGEYLGRYVLDAYLYERVAGGALHALLQIAFSSRSPPYLCTNSRHLCPKGSRRSYRNKSELTSSASPRTEASKIFESAHRPLQSRHWTRSLAIRPGTLSDLVIRLPRCGHNSKSCLLARPLRDIFLWPGSLRSFPSDLVQELDCTSTLKVELPLIISA